MFGSSSIPLGLEIHIDYLCITIQSALEVVLLATDFHKDFIDVAGVTKASVLSFQS